MDVNKKVEQFIKYNSFSDDTSSEGEYQSTFEKEGVRKSKYILDAIKLNDEASKENLSEYIFVSIGGADGSEAEEILKNTPIKKAILVEYSDIASDNARKKQPDLLKQGKELIIMQGDATQRLPDVINRMKNFQKKDGITGLILSIQAVIHELPRRSPTYRENVFFGQLFRVFTKNMYFGREPIKPSGWPNIVNIKVGNASSENLSKLADIINEKLKITNVPVTSVSDNFINVDSTLALELLHKLIRPKTVSAFKYELGEQLTSVDPFKFKRNVENQIGKATVTLETTTTEGFKNAWKLYEVKVKDDDGLFHSFPITHARFLGFALTPKDTTSNITFNSDENSEHLLNPPILTTTTTDKTINAIPSMPNFKSDQIPLVTSEPSKKVRTTTLFKKITKEEIIELNNRIRNFIIRGQLHLLINLLHDDKLLNKDSLYCTYYMPCYQNKNELIQTFDYLPNGKGKGRIISTNQGLVGNTFVGNKLGIENFQSNEEHDHKMVSEYKFKYETVVNRPNKKNSYLTYPIYDDMDVLGVIYLESDIVNTFSDEKPDLINKIIAACKIIDENACAIKGGKLANL